MDMCSRNFTYVIKLLPTFHIFHYTYKVKKHYFSVKFSVVHSDLWGTAVVHWLRYCATNQKVAGSIPDGVPGIFH